MTGQHAQCGCEGFFFSGVDPKRFAYPQIIWPFLPHSFVFYRVALALYQVATFASVVIFWGVPPFYPDVETKLKWFLYVSDWAFVVTTLYILWAAVTTVYWHTYGEKRNDPGFFFHDRRAGGETPPRKSKHNLSRRDRRKLAVKGAYMGPMTWYFKLTWFLQVIACSSQLGVSLFFWTVGADLTKTRMNFFTLNVNLISFLVVLADYLLSAYPSRIFHVIYTVVFGCAYFVFIYFYQSMMGGTGVNGDSFIYEEYLDWNEHPMMSYMVSIVAVVVVWPLFHLFYFTLYWVKYAMTRFCCPRSDILRKFADQ